MTQGFTLGLNTNVNVNRSLTITCFLFFSRIVGDRRVKHATARKNHLARVPSPRAETIPTRALARSAIHEKSETVSNLNSSSRRYTQLKESSRSTVLYSY